MRTVPHALAVYFSRSASLVCEPSWWTRTREINYVRVNDVAYHIHFEARKYNLHERDNFTTQNFFYFGHHRQTVQRIRVTHAQTMRMSLQTISNLYITTMYNNSSHLLRLVRRLWIIAAYYGIVSTNIHSCLHYKIGLLLLRYFVFSLSPSPFLSLSLSLSLSHAEERHMFSSQIYVRN